MLRAEPRLFYAFCPADTPAVQDSTSYHPQLCNLVQTACSLCAPNHLVCEIKMVSNIPVAWSCADPGCWLRMLGHH